MQKFWNIFLTVALFVSLICHAAFAVQRSIDETRLVSTVKAPLRVALAEVEKDVVSGRRATALKKLAELRQESDQFFKENGFHRGFGNILIRFRKIEEEATSP